MSEKTSDNSALALDEFTAPELDQWRGLVEAQLAEADIKKLQTSSVEGIEIRALYSADKAHDSLRKSMPGAFPFTRHTSPLGHSQESWEICPAASSSSVAEFNETAHKEITRGLTALKLSLDQQGSSGLDASDDSPLTAKGGTSVSTAADLSQAISGLADKPLSLHIDAGTSAFALAALLTAAVEEESLLSLKSLTIDPFGLLLCTGSTPCAFSQLMDEAAALVLWANRLDSKPRTISIDARAIAEAGGSMVHELGAALSMGVEILRALVDRGIPIEQAANSMLFRFSVGSEIFKEIAKFRAARSLWAQVVNHSGGTKAASRMVLHALSLNRNKTSSDPFVNILRTTTEGFAAVIGGAELLELSDHDYPDTIPQSDARRIARNIQIILREESHFGRVIDPAGGSWFMESFTDDLRTAGWKLFQDLEAQGGMLSSLEQGSLQKLVRNAREQRLEALDHGHDVLVGTSKYVNLNEALTEEPSTRRTSADRLAITAELERILSVRNTDELKQKLHSLSAEPKIELAAQAAKAAATLGEILRSVRSKSEPIKVSALPPYRDSQHFEQLRRNAARFAKQTRSAPTAFLATIGPAAQHKTRSEFTRNFLAPGGIRVHYQRGFSSAEEAGQAFLSTGLRLAVICSSDDNYPQSVPEFTRLVKAQRPDAIIVLAGYPKGHLEAFREAGVDQFIYSGANIFTVLSELHRTMGLGD